MYKKKQKTFFVFFLFSIVWVLRRNTVVLHRVEHPSSELNPTDGLDLNQCDVRNGLPTHRARPVRVAPHQSRAEPPLQTPVVIRVSAQRSRARLNRRHAYGTIRARGAFDNTDDNRGWRGHGDFSLYAALLRFVSIFFRSPPVRASRFRVLQGTYAPFTRTYSRRVLLSRYTTYSRRL